MSAVADPYVPTIPRHPDAATTSPGGSSIDTGTGAPTGTGNSGDFYVNVTSGDVYIYFDGSWHFFISGAGGSNSTATGADPSVDGGKVGDLWINNTNNKMWFWTGTAWQQIIGA